METRIKKKIIKKSKEKANIRINQYKPIKEIIVSKLKGNTGYIRDLGTTTYITLEKKRREFGAHLTSVDIFMKFIFPEIKNILYKYIGLIYLR